jgi:hypothetical protein
MRISHLATGKSAKKERQCFCTGRLTREIDVASHKEEGERRGPEGIPSLNDLVPGKVCGAFLPLSEQTRTQMRDTMEVIEYLLNRERVVYS